MYPASYDSVVSGLCLLKEKAHFQSKRKKKTK